MAVRVGVDVGGTFTKAVACDFPPVRWSRARSCRPRTTVPRCRGRGAPGDRAGRGRGRADGLGPIELVTHSTTQAVNALLEGDTARVGVLGIGRRPDLRRSRKRTAWGRSGWPPGIGSNARVLDGTAESDGRT